MGVEAEHADMGRTSIGISEELADELHGRKDRGDSYEDVIWRLIEESEDK
jgi:predicted CopG family antitoxin